MDICKEKNGTEILYQCEIKNSSASAIGGRSLSVDANNKQIQKISQYHWEQEKKWFSKDIEPNGVTKVLLRMDPNHNKNIKKYMKEQKIRKYQQKPLLIYWMPISSDKKGNDPFSTKKIPDLTIKFPTNFKIIDIFSVSLYLRTLKAKGEKTLIFKMPSAERRMEILNKIIPA